MTMITPLQRALFRLDEIATAEEKLTPTFAQMERWIRRANIAMQTALQKQDFPYPASRSLDQNLALHFYLKDFLRKQETYVRNGQFRRGYFCDSAVCPLLCALLIGIPFYYRSKYLKEQDRPAFEAKRDSILREYARMNFWVDQMVKGI